MDLSEKLWPGIGEGVSLNTTYTYDTPSMEFIIEGDGYHMAWLSDLKLISDGQSFVELIEFSNNAGVIGSKVSQKLDDDFTDNYHIAKEHNAQNTTKKEFFRIYKIWMRIFDMARNNGAVHFH